MDGNGKRQRAVVLLSGGMDSCVCAALAARDYDAAAMHVMYGQRTEERERRAFEAVCERLGIERRMVVRNEALRQIGGSALTDSSIAVPRATGEFEGRGTEAAGEGARSGNDSCEVGGGPGEGAGAHPTSKSELVEGAGAYQDSRFELGSGGSRGPSTRACALAQDDSRENIGANAGEGAGAKALPLTGDVFAGVKPGASIKPGASLEPGAADAHAGARVPHGSETSATPSEVPVTYVPFRNAHFLAAAVSWAEVLGAEKIIIGAVEQDSSGYPDCRPAYYRAFNQVILAGTREGKIEIVTPLIGMRKAEIVTLGLELGVPFHLTWSCYSREDRACGVCESCVLRLRAFQAAGASDPITYVQEGGRDRS